MVNFQLAITFERNLRIDFPRWLLESTHRCWSAYLRDTRFCYFPKKKTYFSVQIDQISPPHFCKTFFSTSGWFWHAKNLVNKHKHVPTLWPWHDLTCDKIFAMEVHRYIVCNSQGYRDFGFYGHDMTWLVALNLLQRWLLLSSIAGTRLSEDCFGHAAAWLNIYKCTLHLKMCWGATALVIRI